MKINQQSILTRIIAICFFMTVCLLSAALFSATAWAEDITLAWDANSEDNLAGYKLYYKSGSGGAPYDGAGLIEGDSPVTIYLEALADTEAPVFTLTGLAGGTTYYFALTAFDSDGLESDYSDEVSYTTNASEVTSHTITASATGQGTITPAGAITVSEGASQTFTITAAANYHIAGVSVDGSSVGQVNTYTFENVSASHTIGATFEIDTFTITATAGENGSISPQGVTSAAYGTSVSYTITPADGYHISNVLVDGSSVGQVSTYAFENVSASHTIGATFEIDTFTVTATAGENGSISPQGITSAAYGTSLSFTITPADGYYISDVLVDGSSVGQVSSYVFENISTWHTIEAAFGADSDGGIIVDDPVVDEGDVTDPPADNGDTTTDSDSSTGDDTSDSDTQAGGNQAPLAPVPSFGMIEASGVGPVTLTVGAFSDPDSGDSHLKTEWRVFRSEDGVCIFNIASTSSLTEFRVPDIMLDEYATYYWNARFYDSSYAASEWSETAYFTTGGSDTDTDGDGVPDSQEVDDSVDMNQDGIPDAEQEIVKSIVLPLSNQTIGLSIENSDTAMSVLFMEAVDLDSLTVSDANKTRARRLPLGLINFKLSVAEPGDTAVVTIYFSERVNPNAKWMKLDVVNDTWLDYSGYAQLSQDLMSMSIELVDGGFGDDDGVANGIIIDPAGLELAVAGEESEATEDTAATGSDSGSGGCFITGAADNGLTGRPMTAAGILLLLGVAVIGIRGIRSGRPE